MPHRNSAGMVKMVPVASEVDAEATVCDRLASRIVPRVRSRLNTATVMTAAGIEADTVMPTRSPRYALAAPNTMPSRTPTATALRVNSATSPETCCMGRIMTQPGSKRNRQRAPAMASSRTDPSRSYILSWSP